MIGDIKIFQIIRYMINTHYGLDKSSQQYPDLNIILYNWPAHPDDPQGIRVASVIEFSVCVLNWDERRRNEEIRLNEKK